MTSVRSMAVEARDYLQLIEDAVRHMGMMVDALLKMAVLRRRSLQLSHSELNPIVDEVIRCCSRIAMAAMWSGVLRSCPRWIVTQF